MLGCSAYLTSSERVAHNQSTEPSSPTSAAVCVSPIMAHCSMRVVTAGGLLYVAKTVGIDAPPVSTHFSSANRCCGRMTVPKPCGNWC